MTSLCLLCLYFVGASTGFVSYEFNPISGSELDPECILLLVVRPYSYSQGLSLRYTLRHKMVNILDSFSEVKDYTFSVRVYYQTLCVSFLGKLL